MSHRTAQMFWTCGREGGSNRPHAQRGSGRPRRGAPVPGERHVWCPAGQKVRRPICGVAGDGHSGRRCVLRPIRLRGGRGASRPRGGAPQRRRSCCCLAGCDGGEELLDIGPPEPPVSADSDGGDGPVLCPADDGLPVNPEKFGDFNRCEEVGRVAHAEHSCMHARRCQDSCRCCRRWRMLQSAHVSAACRRARSAAVMRSAPRVCVAHCQRRDLCGAARGSPSHVGRDVPR